MTGDKRKKALIVRDSRRPGYPFRFLLAGLFVLAAALFLASSFWTLRYWSDALQISFASGVIELNAQSYNIAPPVRRTPGRRWHIDRNQFPDTQFHLPVFSMKPIVHSNPPVNYEWYRIVLPLWLPLAILLSTLAFLYLRRHLERNPAICDLCGYNLTGNTSGRCPECGHATLDHEVVT